MYMLPLGTTILLWREERGLRQEELSQKALLSRPNLSAIERGKRDVTLKTLRLLASALDITPGVLADGRPPRYDLQRPSLDRETLERIAEEAAGGKPARTSFERDIARDLSKLIRSRQLAMGLKKGAARRGGRDSYKALTRLKANFEKDVLQSLLKRTDHHGMRINERKGH